MTGRTGLSRGLSVSIGVSVLLISLAPGATSDKEPAPAEKPKADKPKKPAGNGEPSADTKKPATETGPSLDEQYVREHLKDYLHASKLEFLEDGRVKMFFELHKQQDEHRSIFTPAVSDEINSRFRWSLREEWYYGWYTDAVDYLYRGGLRISMDSAAHLNVWFQDDVEAEMHYIQGINYNPKQRVAVVFTNGSGKSVGSNYGSQCAKFSNLSLESAPGKVDQVVMGKLVKNKLVVRNGTFEAYRNGKLNGKAKYTKSSFKSGRVGFIWGGSIAGFISQLEITGRIDSKKMAEFLRKAK